MAIRFLRRAALFAECASSTWVPSVLAQHEPAAVAIVRSGEPRAWAALIRSLANQGSSFQAMVRPLGTLLKSESVSVRRRAAQALSALGPVAIPAVPNLIAALADADSGVRAESAFALHNSGERSERVLRALYRESVREASASTGSQPTPLSLLRMNAAIEDFDPRAPVAASDSFVRELRADLGGATGPRRLAPLRVLARTSARSLSDYLPLLGDPAPGVRVFVARSLGSSGDTSVAVRAALTALAQDSVERVRIAGRGWLESMNRPSLPWVATCRHRSAEGAIRATVEIPPNSVALRGDGQGPYMSRRDSVDAYHGVAFNFELLPSLAGAQPGFGRRRTTFHLDARVFEIDLTVPITTSGAVSLGVVRDPEASLHTFYLVDANRVIWNTRDIPVGARVASDRTELTFAVSDRWHRLQFGPSAMGDCEEEYAQGARINGRGTTPVWVERLSVSEYRIVADSGAVGRLWEYSNPAKPVDRGLYRFPFTVLVKAP